MVAAVTLNQPLPSVVRVGQTVAVAGRLKPATHGAKAELEYLPPMGAGPQKWSVVASAPVGRSGTFSIRWAVKQLKAVPIQLRVAAVRGKRLLATTKPVQSAVGPAMVACAPPVPPAVNIPVGDGWIEGGAYIMGGPFPGLDECLSQSYTVTATDTSTGQVAATMTVAGGHSYTLVVPAGSYSLATVGGCPARGTATVTAGKATMADADCDVP